MEDLLLEPVVDTRHLSVMLVVSQLRQEVTELRAEVAQLQRANLELRQQGGYWKSRHAQGCQRIAVWEAEVEQLRGENRNLQAQASGRTSEKPAAKNWSKALARPRRPR